MKIFDFLRHGVVHIRLAALLLSALLVILVVPMLGIARYDVPSADDFSFGARAHHCYEQTGSFFAAVGAAAEEAKTSYNTWQGTFSAIFLMALQPGVFGEELYALTAPIMLLALLGGIYFFCTVLFKRVFGASASMGACVAALSCILCTQLTLSPVQGFYWYNGAVYYTLFYGLALAALALGVRTAEKGGVWRTLLLALLAFFIGGGNYVTMLTMLIVGASALGVLLLCKDKRAKRLIVPLAALCAAAALSMTAPGNAVRQANYAATPGAIEAILLSFRCAAVFAYHWTTLPVIGTLIFAAALMWRAAKSARFDFRFPGLVTAWSVCVYAAMFCPPIYAMGDAGDVRLVNIIFFAYILGALLNLFYWLGWLSRHIKRAAAHNAPGDTAHFGALAAGAAVTALCFSAAVLSGQPLTSVSALSSLRTGAAAEYYACAERRYEILNDKAVTDAVLPAFPTQPLVLYYDDITTMAWDWRNGAVQYYYGKNSVVVGG